MFLNDEAAGGRIGDGANRQSSERLKPFNQTFIFSLGFSYLQSAMYRLKLFMSFRSSFLIIIQKGILVCKYYL